jgi:hypothetical protein
MNSSRYSLFINDLEHRREGLAEEIKQKVYDHYSLFIKTYQQLKNLKTHHLQYTAPIEACSTVLEELLTPPVLPSTKSIGQDSEKWAERADLIDSAAHKGDFEACINALSDSKEISQARLQYDLQVLKLTEMLTRELQKPTIREPKKYLNWLVKLEAESTGIEAYLVGRGHYLRQHFKKSESGVPAVQRLSNIANMFFSVMRASAEELRVYQAGSRLHLWVQEQLNELVWVLNDLAYLLESMDELVTLVAEIFKACRTLDDIGLSVKTQLQACLFPMVQIKLQELFAQKEMDIDRVVRNDLFNCTVIQVKLSKGPVLVRLTSSCSKVIELLQTLSTATQAAVKLWTTALHGEVWTWLSLLTPVITQMLSLLALRFVRAPFFDQQKSFNAQLQVLTNCWNLAEFVSSLQQELASALILPPDRLTSLTAAQNECLDKMDERAKLFFKDKFQREVRLYTEQILPLEPLITPFSFRLEKAESILGALEQIKTTMMGSTDGSKEATSAVMLIAKAAVLKLISESLSIIELRPGGFQQVIALLHVLQADSLISCQDLITRIGLKCSQRFSIDPALLNLPSCAAFVPEGLRAET